MSRNISFLERAGIAILTGLLVGVLISVFECLFLHYVKAWQGGEDYLYAAALYGAVGATAGLGIAVVMRRNRPVFPVALACHFTLFVFIVLLYYVNLLPFLPSMISFLGALLNGVLFLIIASIGFGIFKLVSRFRKEGGGKAPRVLRLVSPLLVAAGLAIPGAVIWTGCSMLFAGDPANRPSGGQSAEGKPNIVFLVIDTIRKDHISGYGYERETTPCLDKLMEDSVVFDNATAPSCVTVPSVASFFTGMGPSGLGFIGTGYPLPSGPVTLAEALGQGGYFCSCFLGNAIVDAGGGFDRGFHTRFPREKPGWFFRLRTAIERLAIKAVRESNYHVGENLMKAVDSWSENAGDHQPFFAYIHLLDPHSPYSPPKPYDTLFDDDFEGTPVTDPPMGVIPADFPFLNWEALEPGASAIPPRELRNMIARYDGEIVYTDALLGEFFEKLKKIGLYDNTLILVTADHGEEFYDHTGWFHGQSMYRELTDAPLIVKLPEQRWAGTRRKDRVSCIGIFNTIVSYVGLDVPEGVKGWNFLEEGSAESEAKQIFCERPPFLYSVTEGDWKLTRKKFRESIEYKLYNLEKDPGETKDVAGDFPEIRDRLMEIVDARLIDDTGITDHMLDENMTSDQRERMKELGYGR